MHFQSSGAYVTQTYKFRACGAFTSQILLTASTATAHRAQPAAVHHLSSLHVRARSWEAILRPHGSEFGRLAFTNKAPLLLLPTLTRAVAVKHYY
jgi:hypothetical protein